MGTPHETRSDTEGEDVKPTVYLFDVDGTLISTGGAGRKAIVRSFEKAFGKEGISLPFSFAGMTDRLIVRRGLEALDLSAHESAIDHVLEDYLEILADEVEGAQRYLVHPGMEAALETLTGRPNIALGLGTGNLEEGARIKLERVKLNHYFPFGGFGCDAEDRNALILVGARRGAKLLGRPLEACRVVIIGDTPRDVEAARFVGGECIAVATGGATWEELEQSRPDWLFGNLEAEGALEALMG